MNIFSSILNYASFLTQKEPNNNSISISIFLLASTLFYFITCVIRFRKQLANEEYFDKNQNLPSSNLDYLIKIITVIYYSLILYTNFDINAFTKLDANTLINFAYHFIVIYTIFSLLLINYYPWFLILPLFISTMINLGVNRSIFLFILSLLLSYFGLTNRPYTGRKNYDRIRSCTTSLILISLLHLY